MACLILCCLQWIAACRSFCYKQVRKHCRSCLVVTFMVWSASTSGSWPVLTLHDTCQKAELVDGVRAWQEIKLQLNRPCFLQAQAQLIDGNKHCPRGWVLLVRCVCLSRCHHGNGTDPETLTARVCEHAGYFAACWWHGTPAVLASTAELIC